MPNPPVPVRQRLRSLLQSVYSDFERVRTSISRLNELIAIKIGMASVQRLVQLEMAGVSGLALSMMQIGEHLLAIALWLLFSCIWLAKATTWTGECGSKLIGLRKSLYVIGVLVACSLFISITIGHKGAEPWSNLSKFFPSPCSVSVTFGDEIVDRVHLRSFWHHERKQTDVYQPKFQDLYHVSIITLRTSRTLSHLTIKIQDARKPTDNIRVEPSDDAQISEAKPEWISGFEEPAQVPDFWVRTITFSKLNDVAVITIRKPVKSKNGENALTGLDLDLDRKIQTSAENNCKIVATLVPPIQERLNRLVKEIRIFVAQTVSAKTPTVTRLDPDEPYPTLAIDESELVEELRCKDSDCANMTVTMVEKTRER